jgi:hypothetical protein
MILLACITATRSQVSHYFNLISSTFAVPHEAQIMSAAFVGVLRQHGETRALYHCFLVPITAQALISTVPRSRLQRAFLSSFRNLAAMESTIRSISNSSALPGDVLGSSAAIVFAAFSYLRGPVPPASTHLPLLDIRREECSDSSSKELAARKSERP